MKKLRNLDEFSILVTKTAVFLTALFFLLRPTRYEGIPSYFGLVVCIPIWLSYLAMVVRERKIDRVLPPLFIYVALLILSSLLSGNDVHLAIWTEGIACLTIPLFFAVELREDASYFLKTFYLFCILILIWNLFSFQEPFWTYAAGDEAKAGTETTLIGWSNIQASYFFPALFAGLYLYETGIFNGKSAAVIYILLYTFSVFCAYFFGEKGNLITLVLWGLLLIVGYWVPLEKVFDPFVVLVLDFLMLVAIQIYNPNNPGFIKVILDKLGKSVTLSGRTTVWEDARASIASYPVLGVGVPAEPNKTVYIASKCMHAHNIFLNVLVKTGIIGMCAVIWVLVELCRVIRRVNNRRIKWLAIAFFISMSVNLQCDINASHFTYCFVALLYYSVLAQCPEEKKKDCFFIIPENFLGKTNKI